MKFLAIILALFAIQVNAQEIHKFKNTVECVELQFEIERTYTKTNINLENSAYPIWTNGQKYVSFKCVSSNSVIIFNKEQFQNLMEQRYQKREESQQLVRSTIKDLGL
jgi:hypothetical protein